MIFLLFFLISSNFNEYFNDNFTILSISNQRQSLSTNFYLLFCFFHNFITTSQGGCIYISNSVVKLLIESTSFIKSSTSSTSGVIFFNGNGIVLKEICTFECKSGSKFHFGSFQTLTFIKFIQTSIIKTPFFSTISSSYPIKVYLGDHFFNSFNYSYSYCSDYSSIWSLTSTSSIFKYFNLHYSYATGSRIIYFQGCLNTSIYFMNFISNRQDTTGYGLFFSGWSSGESNTSINSSIFYNNTGNLFCNGKGLLYLTDCFIDIYLFSYITPITFNINLTKNLKIYSLSIKSTYFCEYNFKINSKKFTKNLFKFIILFPYI